MASWLTVFTGPMFAGKTEALIHAVKRARKAELPVQVFAPASDTRNGVGVIKSHGGIDIESLDVTVWAVGSAATVGLCDRVRDSTRVVAIDEAQFFDPSIVGQVKLLQQRDLLIYVAGLDCDYKQDPFGPMPQLLALADDVRKLNAICSGCKGLDGRLTYRSVVSTEQVLLGAAEAYAPMCRACYSLTQRTRSSRA